MIGYILAVLTFGAGLHAQVAVPTTPVRCDATSFDCAMILIEKGDYDAAITGLTKALSSTPRDLKALNLLGIALTSAGRVEEADRRFRQALEVDPLFQAARKNLAVNAFNSLRHDAAERLFKEVVAQVPDDQVAHVHLAEIHYLRKQTDQALLHYEKSGGRVMTRSIWMLHYASSLLERGRTARAVGVLDQLPLEDGASRFEAGVALGRAAAYADAARQFGAARSTYKDAYAAGYNQTLMLIEAGDFAGAIGVAEALFQASQKTGELYNLISRAYVATNRIQEAYDALRTAARLEPTAEQHYLDLALICLDHENFDLGMEVVDVGLKYTSAAPRLHLYRGVLLVMKGLVDQAEREFESARKLAPDGPVPDVALAMALMQSGRAGKAVELLRERAKARSGEAIVPYMLGIAVMRSGVDPMDPAAAEALHAFEAAVKLDPALAGARAELGKLLLARGDTQPAIEHLERATALDPENPAPAYLLAQAYRKSGDTDRARELLARVSKLNAQGRGDNPDRELKRTVLRLVREGPAAPIAR